MNIEAPLLWKRLAWFVGLWALGVATVGTVAMLIRAVLL
jgi:hypothetical protein